MSQFIYGIHALKAIIEKNPERIIEVYALKGRDDKRMNELLNGLRNFGISVQFANRQTLDKKANGENHQGVIAKVKPAKQYNENDLMNIIEQRKALGKAVFLLLLDGVTDPHNLGACLRSADAAGVDAVIVPKNNSCDLNGVVRKVACGAAETVPLVTVTNLARTMKQLQDEQIWIVGTAGETDTSIFNAKLKGNIALVMGAEGDGMRRLTREHCDELVKIPMQGSVSSLNVSVATGICLFEVLRQNL